MRAYAHGKWVEEKYALVLRPLPAYACAHTENTG